MNSTSRLRVPVLAAVGAVLLYISPAAIAQTESETKHHGYEHGYRDGFAYGRDVHARGASLDVNGDAYQRADHGFRPEFGPKEEYETGYREGYRQGADDGYANRTERFEKMFGEERTTPPNDGGAATTSRLKSAIAMA